MHMNIAITLRLMMTPTVPIVNKIAESARYHESCGSIEFVLFRSNFRRRTQTNSLHSSSNRPYARRFENQLPTSALPLRCCRFQQALDHQVHSDEQGS